MIVGGMLITALHIQSLPPLPGETQSPQTQFLISLLLSPVLALSLLPLARGVRGRWLARILAIAGLVFVAIGLNTIIELSIFSNMLPNGDFSFALFFAPPALLLATAITIGKPEERPSSLAAFPASGWTWRLALAWLSFPVIYFLFGAMIAPIVVPYYNAGVAGLKIPPLDAILRTQMTRSLLFLLASLPATLLWAKSRSQFIVAMGLAHAMTIGIFQLAQAGFMPMALRVTHSLEITADSMAYAAVLGLLFIRKKRVEEPSMIKTVAAA
jgi:hypothetical protein